ncbi:MAG: hypothetical protein C0412_15445 [Flavobacterium sp.]|nr:hypothetical protein [Flavobacterium sp.]
MADTLLVSLSPELIKQFNISKIHSKSEGSQKKVFIVTKNGVKCALKLFVHFGKREARELKIYEEYKHIDGIPRIISIENFNGDTIVFEEFIDGANLHDIAVNYAGNFEKIKELIVQICLILEPIWKDNRIHRDIKLSNIMIRQNGKPIVIDFGIALDLNGTVYTNFEQPLSWDFASPEQLLGQRDLIDYRSDFFSLGVVAYTLYYQRKPFGDSHDEITQKFAAKDNSHVTDADCKFNPFFKECFGIAPADRPRNLATIFKLLKC